MWTSVSDRGGADGRRSKLRRSCQLSSSHHRGALAASRGPVGTAPSCLFCVLTPRPPTLPKHHATYSGRSTCPLWKTEECKERRSPNVSERIYSLSSTEKNPYFVLLRWEAIKSIKSGNVLQRSLRLWASSVCTFPLFLCQSSSVKESISTLFFMVLWYKRFEGNTQEAHEETEMPDNHPRSCTVVLLKSWQLKNGAM